LKKRILLVQEVLRPPGGVSAVAAWILEALKDNYEITVLTGDPPDLDGLNRFYGTSLQNSDISVLAPSAPIRRIAGLDPDVGSIQLAAYLMRMTRRYRKSFDLVMAAGFEEMDLGGPGLVYVHHPELARFWKTHQDSRAGVIGLLQGKTRPWTLVSGFRIERFKQNTILVNSDWTGRRVHEAYGMPSQTVYPPVTTAPKQLAWNDRENTFVATGRLVANKRLDWIVQTLSKVRQQHPDIRLHLVGSEDSRCDARDFLRTFRALLDSNRDWVHLHEDLSREGLMDLMGRTRYGIHALVNEHFGMAPAEALMAGCIPFVHNSGGQTEITGADPHLCYQDSEAAEKITAVLNSAPLQKELLQSLAQRRKLFTVEHFVEQIRAAAQHSLSFPSRDREGTVLKP
jgi:glycosyltransferase involved in cell wall biosynthesis